MRYTLIVSIKKIKISIQFLYLTNTADILIYKKKKINIEVSRKQIYFDNFKEKFSSTDPEN